MRLVGLAGLGALMLMLASIAGATQRLVSTDDHQNDPTSSASASALTFVQNEPEVDPPDVVGPISEEQALAIGTWIAGSRSSGEATLTSIEQKTFGEVVREHGPGTDIYGWPVDMQVFELHYTGGPFDLIRSRPVSRPDFSPVFTGMYVVVSVEDGEVVGTGSLDSQ